MPNLKINKSLIARTILILTLSGSSYVQAVEYIKEVRIIDSIMECSNTVHLDRLSIIRIFTKKDLYFPNSDNIISNVYIKPMISLEHQQFLVKVLHLSLYEYQKFLDITVYTGKATPVIEVEDDLRMEFMVKSHPNSIGYINYQLISSCKRVVCDDCD